jgi:YD repeat-containing protein
LNNYAGNPITDAMTYDANGNPTRVENDSTTTVREMYWDEDNRLMVLSDNGKTSHYTYNHAGERAVKSHGSMECVYINGVPKGASKSQIEQINKAVKYASEQNVQLNVRVVK